MTSAERQAALRSRRADAGIVQVMVFVPRSCAANIKEIAGAMLDNPDLEAVARNRKTGRMVKTR